MVKLKFTYLFILLAPQILFLLRVRGSKHTVSISPQIKIGSSAFDISLAICTRCQSNLQAGAERLSWIEARLTIRQNKAGKFSGFFENRFEKNVTQNEAKPLSTRNALFLYQSPCLMTSQKEGVSLNQVKCESEQTFICESNSNPQYQGVATCANDQICWSDDYRDPNPGCLPKPIPGTSVSGNSAYAGERIINGVDADITDHPWSVCLSIGGSTCGGSIISEYLILTARHCLEKRNLETTDIHLMKGRSNRNPQPVALDKSTYQIIFHSNVNVDLVLIKLEEPIRFSHSVSPIALPKNSTNHPAQKEWVTAVGWGLTCKDPPACTVENVMPNLLQSVEVRVADREKWARQYETKKDNPQSVLTEGKLERTFFAGGITKNRDGTGPQLKKDACSGDSGGALECIGDEGQTYICGVTSFGPRDPYCGKTPGGYVMIWLDEILSFLHAQMKKEQTWTGGVSRKGNNLFGGKGDRENGKTRGQGQNDGPAESPSGKGNLKDNLSEKSNPVTSSVMFTLIAMKLLQF